MKLGRDYNKMGWHSCCGSLLNVHDVVKRLQVVEEVALGMLDKSLIPEDADLEEQAAESEEEDEGKDELDVLKERQYGSRKSTRKRAQPSVSVLNVGSGDERPSVLNTLTVSVED